jgi:hypothetical protein
MVNGGDDEKQEINNHVKKALIITNTNHTEIEVRKFWKIEENSSQFKLKIFL